MSKSLRSLFTRKGRRPDTFEEEMRKMDRDIRVLEAGNRIMERFNGVARLALVGILATSPINDIGQSEAELDRHCLGFNIDNRDKALEAVKMRA